MNIINIKVTIEFLGPCTALCPYDKWHTIIIITLFAKALRMNLSG